MKTLLTILLVIFLNSILFAQTNQQPNSKPTEKELSVEQRQIVNLPVAKRKFRPKLSLQRAVRSWHRLSAKHFVGAEREARPLNSDVRRVV